MAVDTVGSDTYGAPQVPAGGAPRPSRTRNPAAAARFNTPPLPHPLMADHSVKKIDSSASPTGDLGQTYLVSGTSVAMRLWEESAGEGGEPHTRPYETVGYVVEGRVEVHVGDDTVTCGAGDSYLVPEGAVRHYKVLDDLVAVEATSPPARVNDRDDA